MRCDGCSFWNLEEGIDYAEVGLCTKPRPLSEVSKHIPKGTSYSAHHVPIPRLDGDAASEREAWRRGLVPEFADLKMFVQEGEGSDFEATMLTKPDFFCAHFMDR